MVQPPAADLGFAADDVINVIQNTTTSTVQMTAVNVWTDVGPTVTITPQTSNKIMVSHHTVMAYQSTYNQYDFAWNYRIDTVR